MTVERFYHSCRRVGLAAIMGVLFAPAGFSTGPDWQVKDAPIRFKINLGIGPTHKSAGYFVQLPDGGLLPAPFPLTQVMTEGGKELASYVMWQNKNGGLALVFESDGSSGPAYVYVTGANKLKLWTPQSGLTPSAITCAQPGSGGMEAAQALGRMGSVGPSVHYRNQPGNSRCTLCLQGDLSGRPPPTSFYMLSYVVAEEPGSTWVAPIFAQGRGETRVDDRVVSLQKRNDKFGGSGQMITLAAGPHKVEMLAACDAGADYVRNGIILFTWAPPKTTPGDLGGVYTTNAVQYAGTPRQESRILRSSEVVKSGECRIQEITLRDGGPAAYFTSQPGDVFWFKDETPTIVYSFAALTTGNPTNTTYTWSLGDHAKPTGSKIYWFLAGAKEHSITLTATWSNKESRCTIPLYAFSSVQSSLDNAATRDSFRKACLSMIKAYPVDADPTVSWDKSLWDTFFDCQELGKGGQLLAEVLIKRSKFFKAKIPQDKQALLQDMLFHSLSYIAPDKAIEWLKEEEKGAKSPDRRNDFKIMQAEVYMYHKKDLAEAKKILRLMASTGTGTSEGATMASIRLGDVAFLEKDVNEANRYWGTVQSRVKLTDAVLKGEDSVKWKGDTPAEPEKAKKEDEKGKDKEKKSVRPAPSLKPIKPLPRRDNVDNWKKSAVLDTGMAAGVITLLTQGAYLDAFRQLQKWERNFPKSKLSSDYMIQEARFYMAIGNRQRARTLLEVYCENVDASSYVADAAELLLQCMMEDKEPDEVLTKFCEKMKKRFQFHPFADRVDNMLRQMRSGGVKMDTTTDEI